MTDLIPVRRALISLSDKTGLDQLAAGLAKHGVEIVSTGGTAAKLRDGVLGAPVDSTYPIEEIKQALRHAQQAGRHGKILGMGGVYDEEFSAKYMALGARMVIAGSDQVFLMQGAGARAKLLRSIEDRVSAG